MAVCYLRSNGMLHGSFCDWFVTVSWFNHMHHADSLVGGATEWRFSKSICWNPSLACHFSPTPLDLVLHPIPGCQGNKPRMLILKIKDYWSRSIVRVRLVWPDFSVSGTDIWFYWSYSGLSFCHQSCYKYLVVIFTEISTYVLQWKYMYFERFTDTCNKPIKY